VVRPPTAATVGFFLVAWILEEIVASRAAAPLRSAGAQPI